MENSYSLSAIKVYNDWKSSAICEHHDFADSFVLFTHKKQQTDHKQQQSRQHRRKQATKTCLVCDLCALHNISIVFWYSFSCQISDLSRNDSDMLPLCCWYWQRHWSVAVWGEGRGHQALLLRGSLLLSGHDDDILVTRRNNDRDLCVLRCPGRVTCSPGQCAMTLSMGGIL